MYVNFGFLRLSLYFIKTHKKLLLFYLNHCWIQIQKCMKFLRQLFKQVKKIRKHKRYRNQVWVVLSRVFSYLGFDLSLKIKVSEKCILFSVSDHALKSLLLNLILIYCQFYSGIMHLSKLLMRFVAKLPGYE